MSIAINSVEVGASVEWIKKGWELFVKAWLKLLLAIIVFYVALFIVGLIPILGQIVIIFAAPCGMVAAVMALKEVEQNADFNLGNIFEKLKAKIIPILIISAVNFALVIAMTILIFALVTGGIAASGAMGSEAGVAATALLSGLITFVFCGIIGIANWFSLPLIALSDISAIDALKASFMASIKNILPMIVFGILLAILFIASVFTLGLGFLVTIPLSLGANYAATRALFPVAS